MEEVVNTEIAEMDAWATKTALKFGFAIGVGVITGYAVSRGMNYAEGYFVRRYNRRQMKVVNGEFGPNDEESEEN